MKVLITGAQGFIGKNLLTHLKEYRDVETLTFCRADNGDDLNARVAQVDFIFHLAGVNRPKDDADFQHGNTDLTISLCNAISASGRLIPILYASSSQAVSDNPYGISKRKAEVALCDFQTRSGNPVHICRLPNVFGKWARPNYNSVVATFCHNIANGLPIQINDSQASLNLVYIDDVIKKFIEVMLNGASIGDFLDIPTHYSITLGALATQLMLFRDSRANLTTEAVGTGLVRALYSTYLSYLKPDDFAYGLTRHEDARGVFVEMLKTRDAGQFSFFTAHPGVTRGGHYHHTKTEKFLVIKGHACFRFRQIDTGEFHEIHAGGDQSMVIETVPGWTHDITNVGEDELIVMLWANEVFDRSFPDTYNLPVGTKGPESLQRENT